MTVADSDRGRLELAPEFPGLDSVRAIGALCVLTTHTTFQSGDYTGHGIWGPIFSRLDVGVAIFFVLSGFLLTRPWIARAAVGLNHPSFGRYYWKRFIRIYPVYAVTVVISLIAIRANADAGLPEWAQALLLADTYTADKLPQGLTQMWSLAVEVAFYVVLPGLMLLALGRRPSRGLRPRRVAVVLLVMTAISCWWHLDVGIRLSGAAAGTPMNWLPAYLTWFAIGISLALAHVMLELNDNPNGTLRTLRLVGAMPGACWSAALGLLLVAATPLGGPTLLFVATATESLTKHLLYAAIGGLVVLTGVFLAPGSRYARLLCNPALRHLGHISFSIFCIHLPVLHFVMRAGDFELFRGHGVQIWLLTVVGSVLAAEVLYRVVERPAQRLRNVSPPWRRDSNQPNGKTHAATTR